MKFKTIHMYKSPKARAFTDFSDEWQYSSGDKKPVKIGQKDDQAYIQSFEDSALTKVFDKFLPEDFDEFAVNFGKPVEIDTTAPAVEADEARADLEFIHETADQIEELRKAYGLSDDLSRAMVLEKAQEKIKEILKNGNVNTSVGTANGSVSNSNASAEQSSTASAGSAEPVEQQKK